MTSLMVVMIEIFLMGEMAMTISTGEMALTISMGEMVKMLLVEIVVMTSSMEMMEMI